MGNKEAVRDSFVHAHMVESLLHEPDWDPIMYCVYNDLTEETTKALIELWDEPNHGLKKK